MTSLKVIDKNRGTIRSNAKDLNLLIHATAIMILKHAKEHGDCSRAQKLLFDLPASFRRTMLRDWFHTFSPIVTKDKEPTWDAKMRPEADKNFVAFDIEGAEATPFYEMAENTPEEKVYSFAELLKMVERLGKQIDKKIEDGKVPEEDILSAQNIANTVKALSFKPVPAANDSDDETPSDDTPEIPVEQQQAA